MQPGDRALDDAGQGGSIGGERWTVQAWELWVLSGILLLAILLRAGWPELTEFKFSEARLEALALEVTTWGRIPLVGVPSSAGFDHSPLSVYLYLPPFLLTSDPRLATVYGGLVGAAAVGLCWWLARRWPLGGRWAAVLSALLMAVGPWAVAFSRKIWQVTFVPLLTLAFAGLMVSALVKGKRWHLAWGLVVLAVLVQVHPSAVSLSLALILWLIVFWRQVRLAPLLAGTALGALSAVPFLVHQFRSGWPAVMALRSLPDAVWDLEAVRLGWEAITGRSIHSLAGSAYPLLEFVPQLGWTFQLIGWLTVVAVLGLGWRLVRGWRARGLEQRQGARMDLILLSWLALPIAFNLRHSLDLYLHFFALVMPAAYLVIGRAAQALFERVPSRTQRTAIALSLAALAVLASAQIAALVLMGRFVASHDTPGGFETPLGHYLGVAEETVAAAAENMAAEVLVVSTGDSPVVDEGPAIFDILLRGRVPHRFVDSRSAAVFPPHSALALVAPGAGPAAAWYRAWPARDLEYGYQLVHLDGTAPENGLLPVTGQRLFENGVELQAYDWQGEAVHGGGGDFWLLWQVLWLSPEDTHFFVHLVDGQGQMVGQDDAVVYPTEARQRGDRILGFFDIKIDSDAVPGPYWARTGLYFYPEVSNVPVVDSEGNRQGDAVLIGPLDATE